jgi:DNA-binding beta-propeller fold protein YncE
MVFVAASERSFLPPLNSCSQERKKMRRIVPVLFIWVLCLAAQAFSQKILTTIEIGGVTGTPAVNATTNTIYVPNNTTGVLDVINGQTNQITANIPIGTSPSYSAVNVNTNLVYVSGGQQTQYIAAVDGSSNTVIATIPVTSGGPMAVNEAANLIYFLNGNGVLSVLDGATNEIIDNIMIAHSCCIQAIAYSSLTNRIYVTMTPHELIVVDAATYKFTAIQFPQIIDLNRVVVDNTSDRVYLSDAGGSFLYVINGNNGQIIATIFAGDSGPVAMSQNNHLIADFGFSVQTRSVFLSFVNSRSYSSVGNPVTFPITTNPYTLTSGPSNRYYVTFYQHDGIAVVSGPQISKGQIGSASRKR